MSETAPAQVALVGVYENLEVAEDVAAKISACSDRYNARVGHRDDYVASLTAETNKETHDTFIAPQAGFLFPKETSRALSTILPLFALIGAVLLGPFGFINFGGIGVGWRVLVCAIMGAGGGGTVAFIAAAGTLSRGPAEKSAVQRGVTVKAWPDTDELREIMAAGHPIRVDQLGRDGYPTKTVSAEPNDLADEGALGLLKERFNQPDTEEADITAPDDPRHGRSIDGQDTPNTPPGQANQ